MSDLGNKEVFAKNLKYYMDITNKTRQDICKALGFKYSTFTDWINGNKYPRIDKIEMLAKYFRIEKSDLIEDKAKTVPLVNGDAELTEYLEELRNRPEQRLLFKTMKGATKAEIEAIVKMYETMQGRGDKD